jgi:hypothetical protein
MDATPGSTLARMPWMSSGWAMTLELDPEATCVVGVSSSKAADTKPPEMAPPMRAATTRRAVRAPALR